MCVKLVSVKLRSISSPGETVLLLETLQSSPISATQITAWTACDSVLSKVAERVLSGWSNTTDDTLLEPLPTAK